MLDGIIQGLQPVVEVVVRLVNAAKRPAQAFEGRSHTVDFRLAVFVLVLPIISATSRYNIAVPRRTRYAFLVAETRALVGPPPPFAALGQPSEDRQSTRLNS